MLGNFTASAKRLRAEHRRPSPRHGDLTDSFVPSDGRAALIDRAVGRRKPDPSSHWQLAYASEPERTITMPLFFFTVEQQERAIVERFGKFVRVAGPGLQRKTPFVERVAGKMSLQVEQLNADIETKTKDNVFVHLQLAVQYKVGPEAQQVQDAYYKLDDPEVQIQSYAFDVVRSHIPSMGLDEAYADANTIAMHIQDTLHPQRAKAGYEIVKALV